MENFLRRFPLASKAILRNLDDKSLARIKGISSEVSKFMNDNERFKLIRRLRRLHKHFKGHEESWKQVVSKTPVSVLRQLVIASEYYFKRFRNEAMSPLFVAVLVDNLELAKHILSRTGNKNPCNKYGYTALHDSISRGHLAMFNLIFEKAEDKNPADCCGCTVLHTAAFEGQLAICRLIMKNIKEKNPADHNGTTPLHLSALSEHVDVYKLIFESVRDKDISTVKPDFKSIPPQLYFEIAGLASAKSGAKFKK